MTEEVGGTEGETAEKWAGQGETAVGRPAVNGREHGCQGRGAGLPDEWVLKAKL